jgi:hypothetical protein
MSAKNRSAVGHTPGGGRQRQDNLADAVFTETAVDRHRTRGDASVVAVQPKHGL